MSTKDTGSNGSTTQPLDEPDDGTDGGQTPADSAPPEELSLNLVFEVLKNERRREVLRYLREHEEQVTLSDLAEHIAALENDTDIASITSSQRKRVYVGLYQCHLPKMADMDIVEFNQNRGVVSIGKNAPQLYQYLDDDFRQPRGLHRYYQAVTGVGALLFVVVLLSSSGPAAVAALGVLTLAVGGGVVYQAMDTTTEA